MQYRLRTLLIVMAVLPPMLAGAWLGVPMAQARYRAWQWRNAVERGEHVVSRGGSFIE